MITKCKVNYYGHSNVYFAYYNGNTWLDEIPKKNNTDNLTFEKAVCDNDATIEWNYEEWTPKVKKLTPYILKKKKWIIFQHVAKVEQMPQHVLKMKQVKIPPI